MLKNVGVLGLLLLSICTSLARASDSASMKRSLAPEDLFALRDISDVHVSPTGTKIAFVLDSFDRTTNHPRSNLWIASVDGRDPKQITSGNFDDSMPRWSPNGRFVAFSSNRGGEPALWVADTDTGRLQMLTPWPHTNSFISKSGEMLTWSPDGAQIAFVAAETRMNPQNTDPRIITRMQYKSRTSFSDGLHTQIFVVSVAEHVVRQLTHGEYDSHSISWSSRGEIAFLSNRSSDPDRKFHYDIYILDPRTGNERKLSNATGVAFSPVWAPDGNSIAYLATIRNLTTIDSIAEDTHVWFIGRDGLQKQVSTKLDRRASLPQWASDSKSIYFLSQNEGETDIFQAFVNDDPPREILHGQAAIRSFSAAGSKLVFVRTDDLDPIELWVSTADGSTPHRISSFNTELAAAWRLSTPNSFWFKSFDGIRVQAWLLPPLDRVPDRKYPLILTVHGGPHGMYGYGFDITNQAEAARGYAVLYMNPRGSSGYGQAFSDGCVNDWGGADYKDLMAGLDEAILRNPWIDRDRIGITGMSYGGYMTNWAITQTQRFKVAVAAGSLSNLISFYGTSLYQDLIHAEFEGMPWDSNNYQKLWSRSPLAHVENVSTPTMFIHGEEDNDVPIEEAEQMYQALRRRGIDAVLVSYPREGHGLHEPLHRMDQINRSLEWFEHYLQH